MSSRNCQIVIAEDNPADVMMVRMALKQSLAQFDLKVIEDGGRMLSYLDEMEQDAGPCPDLLLLDLNMPKAGGLEVMQRMKECTACMRTPVIVLTSSSHPRDREQALALGAAHYFIKPDEFDAFLKIGEVIRKLLRSNEEE